MHKYKIGSYWLGKITTEKKLFYHRLRMNQQHTTVAKKGKSHSGVNYVELYARCKTKKKHLWKFLNQVKKASFGKAKDTFEPTSAWVGKQQIS